MKASPEKGFTLIEVVVVAAIIFTLAGIMVPFAYRVWENTEIDTTRQRMSDLKKAMVGDPTLVQNGLRTHYGYVGDVGQLPSSLENLVTNTDGVSNWNGPYLPSGFNLATYAHDAWGTALQYAPVTEGGKRVSAALASYGPNQTDNGGSGDDIVESLYQIAKTEVLPVVRIQGNLSAAFLSAHPEYYFGVYVRYRNGSGSFVTDTCCDTTRRTIDPAGSPQSYSCQPPGNIPVGMVYLKAGVFSDSSCATSLGGTPLELAINVNGSTIFAALQMQAVP